MSDIKEVPATTAPEKTPAEIAAELEKKATLLDVEGKKQDAARKRELAKKVREVESSTVTGTTEIKLQALQANLPPLEKKDLEDAKSATEVVTAAAGITVAAKAISDKIDDSGLGHLGIKDGIKDWIKEAMLDEPDEDAGFFDKIMHKLKMFFLLPLAKVFGVDLTKEWKEVLAKWKEKVEEKKDKVVDKVAENKEYSVTKRYGEHVGTLVGYMDGLNHSEQDKAINALRNPKLASISIQKLQSVVSTGDYSKLAKETEIDEKTLKNILPSLFCKTPVPVGENYAGYLFQKSLQSMSSTSLELLTLQSVIGSMNGLMSMGSKVVSWIAQKIKDRDISQESIQGLFQSAFAHDMEWDFSEEALRQNAKILFGDSDAKLILKDIRQNAKIQLSTPDAIGLSPETNKYITDKLRPFAQDIDLSVFEKIHPNISASKLKTAMQSASIEDVTQLYIIMGWKKFEELSEDAQGLVYMKLWSIAGENRELQGEIGKTLSQDMLGTYVDKFSNSNTGIPERLRRFMLANCNKAINGMKNGMSEGFAMAWENIDGATKLKVALYFWLALVLYARFRFLIGTISFATIMAGLTIIAPSAYAALKPHTTEMEQKWNTTMGAK